MTTPSGALEKALHNLARGPATTLDGLLHDVESHVIVDGTRVTVHCHCLKLDGNGRPRTRALVQAIAEHVLDYAIPRSRISAAQEDLKRTGSTQKLVRLANEARGLFTDLEKSGEGGELLLFVLTEKILRLPQLICKMSLKTNAQMHVHGADGLHAGVDPTSGKLLLYWGESKIYADVADAVRECLSSLRPMLSESSGDRDLQLLQRHADLNDAALEQALKNYLDPDSVAFNSLEFCGLCLVGFDCEAYPLTAGTAELSTMADRIVGSLPRWRGHVQKRLAEETLDAFAMHFLLVPFPSAEEYRQLLREELGLGVAASSGLHVPTVMTGAAATPPPASSGPAVHVATGAPSSERTRRRAKKSGGHDGSP